MATTKTLAELRAAAYAAYEADRAERPARYKTVRKAKAEPVRYCMACGLPGHGAAACPKYAHSKGA